MKAIIFDMEHTEDGVFEENMIGGPGVEVQVDESKFGVRDTIFCMRLGAIWIIHSKYTLSFLRN